MSVPYILCRSCRANGRTTTIWPSNKRAWESERCFACHQSITSIGQRLARAEAELNALLRISQLVDAGRDFKALSRRSK